MLASSLRAGQREATKLAFIYSAKLSGHAPLCLTERFADSGAFSQATRLENCWNSKLRWNVL